LKLVKTINSQCGDSKLPDERVQKAFEHWWEDFAKRFAALRKASKPTEKPEPRRVEDMVPEILELTRSIHKTLQEEKNPVPSLKSLGLLPPTDYYGVAPIPVTTIGPGFPPIASGSAENPSKSIGETFSRIISKDKRV